MSNSLKKRVVFGKRIQKEKTNKYVSYEPGKKVPISYFDGHNTEEINVNILCDEKIKSVSYGNFYLYFYILYWIISIAIIYLIKRWWFSGGKFKGKKSRNNSLSKWSREKWDYISPKNRKSKRGRYLPEKVRKSLTPKERRSENRRKGSKRGKWVSYSKSVAKKMRRHKIY